jgi:uncharacterized membrane protein (DUF2068 family)
MTQRRGTGALIAIALFKLVKSLLLIAISVGAFSLVHDPDTRHAMRRWVIEIGVDPGRPLLNAAIAKVSGIGRRRLEELGVGTLVYAIVFLVEGTGLLLHRRWAEYLTAIVTASFIPFEVYELAHEPSALKVAGLIVNVLILAYLAFRLWHEHRETQADASASAPSGQPN